MCSTFDDDYNIISRKNPDFEEDMLNKNDDRYFKLFS